jgi:hypothetical protein
MGWGVEGEWGGEEAHRVQLIMKMGSPRASNRHPAEARCWAEARRGQSMVKMKLAGSPRAATQHPAEARCRAEASRVQSMVKMKLVGFPRASTQHPAEARCRTEASRVHLSLFAHYFISDWNFDG